MDIDFQLLIDDTLSEAAQVQQFIDAATECERDVQQSNEQILNRPIEVKIYVDGSISSIDRVHSLSDTVAFEFSIAEDILGFIASELEKYSPVGSSGGSSKDLHPGLYRLSNLLFADGSLVEDRSNIPSAKEYVFANVTPYAEKIEAGESSQAPSGVYELTANEAEKKFGNVKIEFIDYVAESKRHPAIRVKM